MTPQQDNPEDSTYDTKNPIRVLLVVAVILTISVVAYYQYATTPTTDSTTATPPVNNTTESFPIEKNPQLDGSPMVDNPYYSTNSNLSVTAIISDISTSRRERTNQSSEHGSVTFTLRTEKQNRTSDGPYAIVEAGLVRREDFYDPVTSVTTNISDSHTNTITLTDTPTGVYHLHILVYNKGGTHTILSEPVTI
jgi:hypothetical protein